MEEIPPQRQSKEKLSITDILGVDSEVTHSGYNERLRITSSPDIVKLWKETREAKGPNTNMLLACEDNSGDLFATSLTWVVGAAIRNAQVRTFEEAYDTLKQLSVREGELELVRKHCIGLGGDIPWAFYRERHGWLTACPIVDQ